MPTIAPSTPLPVSVAMARRSSRLDTPPEAITGASVRSATARSRSRLGPPSVPSLVTSVTTNREHPSVVKAFQHFPQVAAVGLPAAAAQPVLAVDDLDVQPDGDLVAVLGDHPRAPLRILQGRRAQVDPRTSGGQCRGQRVVVADTAGQFDLHVELAHHLGEQFTIGTAAERGVQVDQMNPLGAVALPAQRGVQR